MNASQCSYLLFIVTLFIVNVNTRQNEALRAEKLQHAPTNLSSRQIRKLSLMSNNTHIGDILRHLLIPRVVGTDGHKRVRDYIVSKMRGLGWDVELDTFEDDTPLFGKLRFHNIITRLNPHAKRYLTLACHYDSKYFRDGAFIGATDSAVPCAQLIDLASDMKKELQSIKKEDLSLMFIFFDGEEAFSRWGPKDSIYGARHLAQRWHRETKSQFDDISELDRIDILVLLDLIGAPDPNFYNYFKETEQWYAMLVEAEKVLASMRQFHNYSYGKPSQKYFQPYSYQGFIEDDHIPFLKRDVPVLHLIPHPFPQVWHTFDDNEENIDISSVENISKILRVFVASYLRLNV